MEIIDLIIKIVAGIIMAGIVLRLLICYDRDWSE